MPIEDPWKVSEDDLRHARHLGTQHLAVALQGEGQRGEAIILGAERTTSGPIGRGTRFVLSSNVMGRRAAVEYEITAHDRPRRMTSRTIRGVPLVDVESVETFEPVGVSTRMRWEWKINPRGDAAWMRRSQASRGYWKERPPPHK